MNHSTKCYLDPEEVLFIAGNQPASTFEIIFDLWKGFAEAYPAPPNTAPQYEKKQLCVFYFSSDLHGRTIEGDSRRTCQA